MTARFPLYKATLTSMLFVIMLAGEQFVIAASQQTQQDGELRDIIKDWKQKRPGSQSSTKKPPVYTVKTRIPKEKDLLGSAGDAEIGVTIWRYRRAKAGDEVRDLVQPKDDGVKEEWAMERVEAETMLSDNQKVRLTIESLRTGYLYVINRAKYADGTYGDSYLIFPTKRIRDGENAVRAGRPIQIPGAKDKSPYLELIPRRATSGAWEVSEELILLITQEPIEEFDPEVDRMSLDQEKVEHLKQRYGAPVERSEMKGGAGLAITKSEDSARKNPLQLLAADDPYPQTIYRVAAKPGDPLLVVLELKVQAVTERSGR